MQSVRQARGAWRVLALDKELIALPALSLLVGMAVFVGLVALGWRGARVDVFVAAVTLGTYAITFLNAALIGAVVTRMRDGDPTVRSALGIAAGSAWPLLRWTIYSLTVGTLLRALGRLGSLGHATGAVAAAGWTVATVFVLPIMLFEHVGADTSRTRSQRMVRTHLGQAVHGAVAIPLLTAIVTMGLLLAGWAAWLAGLIPGWVSLTLTALGIAAGIAGSALAKVYAAIVYAYATDGTIHPAFPAGELRGFGVAS